jgi:hypothetical protein
LGGYGRRWTYQPRGISEGGTVVANDGETVCPGVAVAKRVGSNESPGVDERVGLSVLPEGDEVVVVGATVAVDVDGKVVVVVVGSGVPPWEGTDVVGLTDLVGSNVVPEEEVVSEGGTVVTNDGDTVCPGVAVVKRVGANESLPVVDEGVSSSVLPEGEGVGSSVMPEGEGVG